MYCIWFMVIRLLYYLPMEMTKVDENIQTAQNMLNWIVERCYELEKEVWKWKTECHILEEENKNLNKHLWEKIDTIQVLIREKYEEKGEKLELFKENKNLKKKIELLDNENMCLNAEIKDREEENKMLKWEIERIKKELEWAKNSGEEFAHKRANAKAENKKLKEDVDYFRQCYLNLKRLCEKEWFMLSDEEVTKLFNLDEIK